MLFQRFSFISGLSIFLAAAASPAPAAAAPFDFVAVDWLGRFAHLDPTHGLAAPLRAGLPDGLQALAVSPIDGQVYAANRTNLFTLDPLTGDVTPQVEHGLDVRGMAFSPEGTLYLSVGQSRLYTLDLATEQASLVGELPSGAAVQGLDFSPDGRLFAIGPFISTPSYQLLEIILGGGTPHFVRIGTGAGRLGQSIAFGPDGALYAVGTDLAQLDPATGAVLGAVLPLSRDFRGLTVIPEPTTLCCLLCALAGGVLCARRR